MTSCDIISLVQAHAEEIRRFGVSRLALFGSCARGEATDTSDVDFLVEFGEPIGLFALAGLQIRLEAILGVKKVDLVMPGSIHEEFRDSILSEAIPCL